MLGNELKRKSYLAVKKTGGFFVAILRREAVQIQKLERITSADIQHRW